LAKIEASPLVRIEFAGEANHQSAKRWIDRLNAYPISYTDAVSFAVMEASGCMEALSYDRHFRIAGFTIATSERADAVTSVRSFIQRMRERFSRLRNPFQGADRKRHRQGWLLQIRLLTAASTVPGTGKFDRHLVRTGGKPGRSHQVRLCMRCAGAYTPPKMIFAEGCNSPTSSMTYRMPGYQ
jgi:hypothetical protein